MNGFTYKQRQYVCWLAAGADQRHPPTEAEFAASIGVRVETLESWRNGGGFLRAFYTTALHRVVEQLPDMLAALAEKALSGDVPAIRLARDLIEAQASATERAADESGPGRTIFVYEHRYPDGSVEVADHAPWETESPS